LFTPVVGVSAGVCVAPDFGMTVSFIVVDGILLTKTLCVSDIERDPKVALGYSGKTGIFTGTGVYIAMERPRRVNSRQSVPTALTPDLDNLFDQGVATPNLVLIKVKAKRIKFWDDGDEGEAAL
jgi:general stress protein 26